MLTPIDNATPHSDRCGTLMDPGQMAQARTLAGWIALIAEDRGLDERGVAAATDLDIEDVRAILGGTVFMMPLTRLDRALRRLEGRAH
ncbi:hypothetical protein [Azospirillum sp. sgz302134]